MMRQSLLTLVLCCSAGSLIGCGSESSATTGETSNVPLSINNPESGAKQIDQLEVNEKALNTLLARAQQLAASGRAATAVESLSQAIGLAPENPTIYRVRADVYSAAGEYANALADYSTAVRLEPDNPQLHNLRGFFLMSRGEAKRAEADFTKAIQLKKDFAEAWNNRGLIFLAANQAGKAINDFTQAIKINDKYVDAHNNRGFAHYKMKKFNEAEMDLNRALQINPEYVNSYNNRGLVRLQTKEFDKAVQDFTEAIKRNRFDRQYYVSRRVALLQMNQLAAARADAERIGWLDGLNTMNTRVAQDPGDPRGYVNRGRYFERAGEQESAIVDYSRAIQLNPADTTALIARAAACNVIGKFDQAIADCTAALKQGENSEAHSVRGDAWLKKGNGEQAVADFDAARRFDNAVAQAYKLRADQFEKAGDTQAAARDREHAKSLESSVQ